MGSGKTTQIPQYVLVDEWNSDLKVVCTQPRRLAAQEVAAGAADELDVKLGDEVGYAVKGDNKNTAETRLVYITEGFLLQQAKRDRRLSELSCVIIDEAQERTVDTDMLLGLLA
ncbi:hypothetical protein E8E14_008884 [Neopestalotiopsis sp. 37M]|nr:hypothetical protein E8E14_008884 [Neopestalotiopsis sp. 37M]